ncbi:MAG: hypothetical protein IH948_03890 [Bacteroidetes bacterium]|nr:hypothetical protein [Bacteroidota bacterium]
MKSHGRKLNVRAIIFLVALSLLANFFITPTPGVTDGMAGWPIGQADSSSDSSSNVVVQEDSETEESDIGVFTLLWDILQIMF